MKERLGLITMRGNPLTLLGPEIQPGTPMPDCEVTSTDLAPVRLSSFKGKTCVITSVPSLDTSVCDVETRRFNEEAKKLPSVQFITISMDLPFAQKRWCGAADAKNIQPYSDYRTASFGESFGVLIKELRLLARAVFIIDKSGVVRFVHLVKEVTTQPDYDLVLSELKKVQ
jgi:thioredoxin-dependent peroxiredoxin